MRTIFHVGHAKTGSTALQATLHGSREFLRERGILYPGDTGNRYSNHRLLFADLLNRQKLPRYIANKYAADELPNKRHGIVRAIRAEIAAREPECLLFSSEARFAAFDAAQRRGFLATVGEVGARNTEIVVYVRRPSSFYLSQTQQRLRASHTFRRPFMLSLRSIVEGFVEDFGRDRVHLRAFDRRSLAGGDVVTDFASSFLAPHGVEAGDIEPPRAANVSISVEGSDIVRRYRLAFHPGANDRFTPDGRQLNRTLSEVEAGLDLARSAMDPELAERIDYCRDDLLRLRDAHGLVLPGYDYERVERGELTSLPKEALSFERIVAIDRGAQARIVGRLRDTAWAEADPARARWLAELPRTIEAETRGESRAARARRSGGRRMRTLFHVGHQKTGSTALQHALKGSREALLARGVLYPGNADDHYSNHRLLFADLFERRKLPRHLTNHYPPEALPGRRDDIMRAIEAEIAAHRPDCLVLSSETRFTLFDRAQRRAFLGRMEALVGAPAAEIVAYLRRPSSLYLSQVQQTLTASHTFRRPFMLSLRSIVEGFVEDFGRDRVHLRAFDRRSLAGGDVVTDFASSFLAPHGVEAGDIEPPRAANVSISVEGSDIVRRYRLAFHPGANDRFTPDGRQLNRTLSEVEAGLDLARSAMDPELAERIDYCRDDLLRLRDAHGLVLPGYDYERVERGELTSLPKEALSFERIVAIDRGAQARIVGRLRDTAWAEADPARARWLAELPRTIEAETRGESRAALAPAGRG